MFRISDSLALVQTVDFFPPIVDDPYSFGQIAAANALSDIFAMGGRPLTALNIVAFPASDLPSEILTEILRGGNDKVVEAGAVVVGGHSIKDKELKYGIAVTGVVDPEKIVKNSGARPGDRLFLTKPLGTGIITTGLKRGAVDANLTRRITEQMAMLNRIPSELMRDFEVTAATDITGYGLLGHAFEMADASDVTIRFDLESVPMLTEAVQLAGEGMNPGGAEDNRRYLESHIETEPGLDPNKLQVMFDPQTSGGLLIAIPKDQCDGFCRTLESHKLPSQPVGEVLPPHSSALIIR